MAQQTENLNDVVTNEPGIINDSGKNLQNGGTPETIQSTGGKPRPAQSSQQPGQPAVQQQLPPQQPPPHMQMPPQHHPQHHMHQPMHHPHHMAPMPPHHLHPHGGMALMNSSDQQKIKSPSQGGTTSSNNGNGGPPMLDNQQPLHGPYGEPPVSSAMNQSGPPHHLQQPPSHGDPSKDPTEQQQQMMMYGHGPPPGHHGSLQPPPQPHQYPPQRYLDPNAGPPPPDPYGRYHPSVGGGKPTSMVPPNRPPQRYMMGQPGNGAIGQQQQQMPPQTPQTPTLNSLLQSHPPPQHRYPPNSYDPQNQQPPQHQQLPPPPTQGQQQQQQQQQQSSQQYGPGPQQNWAPPPRPYSPQPSYRGPPPQQGQPSRGQSPYPQPGQSPGPYGAGPQQTGGPQPQSQVPPPGASQYSPYPQQTRYPTPPTGPNHRPPYNPHQYQPNRPNQASTPNAVDPSSGQPPPPNPADGTDAIGQNSNDSNSGNGNTNNGSHIGQGTTNPNNSQSNQSQPLRPTPSPTGSSGSRSMSPAVGQQNLPMPPRPSSNHSQVNANQIPSNPNNSQQQHQIQQQQQSQQTPPPQQQQQQNQHIDPSITPPSRPPTAPSISHPPGPPLGMATQGSYQTPPPPHLHGNYKMGPNSQPPGPQNISPYPPQSQQYSQGNYAPRPQYPTNYGPVPTSGQQPPPGSIMPPGGVPGPGQFPGRPMPNHVAPHSQYAQYSQNWGPPSGPQGTIISNHVQGKNTPPPPQVQGGSPRPQLNYLKQHLQHKGSYGGSPSPTPPQTGYGNGSGMHPPMGPPHHMGPPMGPTSMGPPASAPQSNSSIPPPNSHSDGSLSSDGGPQDNGISSSGSSGPPHQHPVTSLITTGPDGAPIDEVSQQSTLSNASIASGEDPLLITPKGRKNDGYNQSHLGPPNSSPSSHGASHEEFEMGSPTWPRTPASPIFNSHMPTENYRSSKKSDSLSKLYDMDDNRERRPWLDKLLSFMEERRTPITSCPAISKTPLDLYRLYLLVQERGGFVEVCKVTKSKTWKDIAGLLGIGASSSAAYTLRKHYTKNILPFECHFDRGGIDPALVSQQVESGSKKKNAKAASVPSPGCGSSNSQDSFPPPGSSSASLDGYGGYPGGYPANSNDYNQGSPMQRPPSQTNTQSPLAAEKPNHKQKSSKKNKNLANAPTASSGDNLSASNPFDDPVGPPRPPYQQTGPPGSPYPPPPTSVPRSPQGVPYQNQTTYNQYGGPEQYGPGAAGPGQYTGQGQFPPPGNRSMYPCGTAENDSNVPPATGASTVANDPYRSYGPGSYPPPQQRSCSPPGVPSGPPTSQTPSALNANQTPANAAYPPPAGQPDYYRQQEQNQARRHPDFTKDQQSYLPYGARPQVYGWPNNGSQYRGQYPPPNAPQQWNSGPRPAGPPTGPPGQPPVSQWGDQHRYSLPSQQPQFQAGPQSQQQWAQMGPGAPPGVVMSNAANPPMRGPAQRGGKPFSMPPPVGAMGPSGMPINKPSTGGPQLPNSLVASCPTGKRDIIFPPDSVEATTPVLYRRKRICKGDVHGIDPWRIFMSLRSGLLSESTWALDVLNILLFDDSSVAYFGLQHLPGLLTLLLEHYEKSLEDMLHRSVIATKSILEKANKETNGDDNKSDIDLGQVKSVPNPSERVLILTTATNYTMQSRKGIPVKIKETDDDIFVMDTSRPWDTYQKLLTNSHNDCDINHWSYGVKDPSINEHVIDTFKGEFVEIPFARFVKSAKKSETKSEIFDSKDSSKENDENSEPILNTNDNSNKSGDKDSHISTNKLNNKLSSVSNTNNSDELDEPKDIKTKKRSNNVLTLSTDNVKVAYDETTVKTNSIDIDSLKREPMDSDCSEVDMEIERMPNGPHSSNQMEVDDDEVNSRFSVLRTVRDPAQKLKRRRLSDYEDECYTRDEASLYLTNESQDMVARRCVCVSNILRNLTFVPGNELVFANSQTFLAILGKVLLLHHDHPIRQQKTRNYEEDPEITDSCSSLQGEAEWWWDYLTLIRENMMVAAANIAGHLQLSKFEEIITRPVLDGLLHWAICPSAHGHDPFPSMPSHSALSPQRLALEALCKLCVTDANVDLVIATPPFLRLEKLCAVLTRHLCRNEDQVLREFSVNLLHYLAAADSAMARTVAMQSPCISYLVAFIEQAEQTALGVANQNGMDYLRENPDSMGTSLDMLRRAAGTLLHLARHPDNRPLFLQQEQRLLGLVMSHILDQQTALIISRVLFQTSRGTGPMTTAELNYSIAKLKLKPITISSTSGPLNPINAIAVQNIEKTDDHHTQIELIDKSSATKTESLEINNSTTQPAEEVTNSNLGSSTTAPSVPSNSSTQQENRPQQSSIVSSAPAIVPPVTSAVAAASS